MAWYNMSTDGTFDMDIMAKRAKDRFEETIQTNPNFYYGPVTGLIARNAGYIFPGRLFRNHSHENPEGFLSKQIPHMVRMSIWTKKAKLILAQSHVRNFFGIYGEEHDLTYREGWERIPENWYKSPVDYGLIQLNLDTIDMLAKYPELGR